MERMLEIPVSVNPTDAIRAMRVIGEESGWQMSRIEETKIVQRWAIIAPMANRARVLGLVVNSERQRVLLYVLGVMLRDLRVGCHLWSSGFQSGLMVKIGVYFCKNGLL